MKENKTEQPKPSPHAAPPPPAKPEPAKPAPKEQPKPKPVEKPEAKPAEKAQAKTASKPKEVPKKSLEPEQVDGKYIVEVGPGGCRGKNWNSPPFPVNQGRLSRSNCAKVCLENGCTAFHMLYEQEDGTAECFLFGHSNVLTVSKLGGQCFALSDTRPTVDSALEEDDTEEEQGELVSERAEMVVLGDNIAVTAPVLSCSSGRMLTPSSTQFMMGLKILFLLLAR